MEISIIIPAYNEEAGIGEVLEDVLAAFPDQPGVELLVVNDASEDATAERASEVREEHKDWPGTVRILSHETNRGYGAAIKTGVAAASHANLVMIDADGTYPASAILDLVNGLETCDMAVGARTGLDVHIPLFRRPAKWLLGKLANYLTGQRIPDLNSGLRALRKPAVERHLRILPDGFSFTTTITMALLTRGDRVRFTPIDYRPRKGESKIRPFRDTLNFLNLILRTAVYFNPLKVLTPLSLLLLLAALVVFVWSWHRGQILDATVSVLVVTGVQVAVLGLLADLVVRRSPD
jgi:glycosyltransferase involved in cell wall biosynthesis